MKNAIKYLVIIALAAVIGFSFVSCDEGGGGGGSGILTSTYSFVNQSSHTVTVTCSDLNPSEFTVSAGATRTATSSKSYIEFLYSPADRVNANSNMITGRITFTNK
jgi:hypothetical protein